MTVADLRAYVNSSQADDEAFLTACWTEARELVWGYVGVHEDRVPTSVMDRAILEVGAELFHRKQAPGGITQFATIDGPSPVRMARDPMLGAYPLLNRWLPGGFA